MTDRVQGPILKSRLSAFDKVAEKNMKGSAKSHQARFLISYPEATRQTDVNSLDAPQLKGPCTSSDEGHRSYHGGEVLAIFVFKYRSTCECIVSGVFRTTLTGDRQLR